MSAPKRRPSDESGPNAGVPSGDAAAVWLPLDALAVLARAYGAGSLEPRIAQLAADAAAR